jgi:hypothetical protein
MSKALKSNQWLYLLTAIMLLTQSFALWHGTEHPFYVDDLSHSFAHQHETSFNTENSLWHDAAASSDEAKSTCDRLNAFAHNPGYDNLAQLNVLVSFSVAETLSTQLTHFLSTKQRDTYSIRAPPTLLS